MIGLNFSIGILQYYNCASTQETEEEKFNDLYDRLQEILDNNTYTIDM